MRAPCRNSRVRFPPACVSSCVGVPPRQMNSYCSHFIAVCLFLLLWDGDVPWDDRALILVLPDSYAFLCMFFPFVIHSSISLLPSPCSGQGRGWELQWVALAMPHASGCLFLLWPDRLPKRKTNQNMSVVLNYKSGCSKCMK